MPAPAPDSVIIRLRPKSNLAVDLAEAVALAHTQAVEQDLAIARAKKVRDDGLLDADANTLKSAERVLADARDLGERVSAVLDSLTTRHAAAVESETLAGLAALRAKIEIAEAQLSKWWVKQRQEFVAVFATGLELVETASNLRTEYQIEQSAAIRRHPTAELPHPHVQPVDAGMWAEDLGSFLRFLQSGSRNPVEDVKAIATIGDPKPLHVF